MKFFDELKDVSFWRDVLTEVICTFFLLLYITFTGMTLDTDVHTPSGTHAGLTLALVVPMMIEAFGPISGCYMNLGITFGAFLKRRMSVVRFVIYSGAQLFGGFAGCSTCWALTPENLRSNIKPMVPSPLISDGQAIAVEGLFTFVLIFTALATTDDSLGKAVPFFSIPVGFAVGAGILASITYTGAALNPAVAFAFAAVNRDFDKQWIYWVAHYSAAIVAAGLHSLAVVAKPKPKETKISTNEFTKGNEAQLEATGGSVYSVGGQDNPSYIGENPNTVL